ncbi:MAG: hypothetical protein Q7S30_01905 [Candidatus Omnitrophota bacterium]|nr:hypothetical protein [Candidatus Omnitrophota bacterium]
MKAINLPENIRKTIDEFVKMLQGVYGEELISVNLYGSAASGEYVAGHSNIDIAVILRDASLSSLSKTSNFINKRKFVLINPIFLTENYIKRSTDVFPIEFIDMKDNHLLLYGRDILKEIAVDTKNLRFQCEHELKSRIINTKRAYLRTTDRMALKRLLFKSATSSLHILRNLLKLNTKDQSCAKSEVINMISRVFGADATPIHKILDAKNKNLNLKRQEIKDLFTQLVGALEAISDAVDQL